MGTGLFGQSLFEKRLNENLGSVVLFRFGQILDSLNELHDQHNIHTIYGNEESGLQWSWNRDKSVATWCNEKGVLFEELSHLLLKRVSFVELRSRDDWKALRDRRIDSSLVEAPLRIRAQDGKITRRIRLGIRRNDAGSQTIASELGFEVRELQQRFNILNLVEKSHKGRAIPIGKYGFGLSQTANFPLHNGFFQSELGEHVSNRFGPRKEKAFPCRNNRYSRCCLRSVDDERHRTWIQKGDVKPNIWRDHVLTTVPVFEYWTSTSWFQ